MADQTFRTADRTASGSSRDFDNAATTNQSLTDQALSAGRDLKDKALGVAGSSSGVIKDQASEFVDAAKDVASQATDKLKQSVNAQKNVGAEYVGSLAETMRRALHGNSMRIIRSPECTSAKRRPRLKVRLTQSKQGTSRTWFGVRSLLRAGSPRPSWEWPCLPVLASCGS